MPLVHFLLTACLLLRISAFKQTTNILAGTGLTYGRMDPIISPGEESGHVHTIYGGDNFDISMDNTQLLNSSCGNTLIKGDLSNYWTPALFFKSPQNGTFYSVPVDHMIIYYRFEDEQEKVVPFTPGFRMVSGNPSLRSPPAGGPLPVTDHAQGAINPIEITCPLPNGSPDSRWPKDSDGMHGVGIAQPNRGDSGAGFPSQYCDMQGAPLRVNVRFPSCFNKEAGLDNYKNNTDWPTNGRCPEGWDHVPHLIYEVYYQTPLFSSSWTAGGPTQPFVLANGDSTGYSFHGDFVSGWDPATLQKLIDTCDNRSDMSTCPGLSTEELFDQATAANCKIPPYNPSGEKLEGAMEKLPGCNPVTGAGPPVKPVVCDGDGKPKDGSGGTDGTGSGGAPKFSNSTTPAQSTKGTAQNANKPAQSASGTAQNANKSAQNANKTAQNANKTAQNANKMAHKRGCQRRSRMHRF